MLKKNVILLALNIVRLVNGFENYNEYLGSLTTTTEADIFSVLDPWAGVKTGQFYHNPDDDGDTDDYNKEPIGEEVNNFRRFLLKSSELKETVIVNKDAIETDSKRVKRASKRTIGSILRARGKTTPGTEFSSEEVDGNKKGVETVEDDVRKDEIKDYDDKSEEKKKKGGKKKVEEKRKEVKQIDLSDEKKDERLLLPIAPEANKRSTTEEPSNIIDAIRERNDKIRKEFEMREEDEKNRISRAEAIKKAEEAEAAKKAAYMLDSGDKSSGKGDKESAEKIRPIKPNKKQAGRKSYDLTKLRIESSKKSKKDSFTDKYAMTLNSGESRKSNSKIITIQNADRTNNRRIAHRKIRRSNAENVRHVNSNDDESRRVNYRQKARENLQAYRDHIEKAVSDDTKVDPLLADLTTTLNEITSKRKPKTQAPADDRKVDLLLPDLTTTLIDIKSKNESLRVNYRQKARENLQAYRDQNEKVVSDDKKVDPLLADLPKTLDDIKSNHKPETHAPVIDIKVDPLLPDLTKTLNYIKSKEKPDDQAPGATLKVQNARRRRGREIFQIPNIAVLDNDYTMYVNDQDYEEVRRNNIDSQNVSVQVSTVITPNKTSILKNGSENELNKFMVPKTNQTEMIISTNLSSSSYNNKPIDDDAVKKISNDTLKSGNFNEISESPVYNDNEKFKDMTTELPLKRNVAGNNKAVVSKRKLRESYINSMKLYGPNIGGNDIKHHKKQHELKSEKADSINIDDGESAKTLIGPVLSSKFSQTAPIHNNYNIENLYVLGSEFIKLKGKPSKRSSCHKSIKNHVEININVENIKDGVHTIIEPLSKFQGGKKVVDSSLANHKEYNSNGEINNNGIAQNPSNFNYGGNEGIVDDVFEKSNVDDESANNGTTIEGRWAKLISKLSDSGFLNIAADYTPKKFDPYLRTDSEPDTLQKDSSSGEYECIKKHKNNTKVATDGKNAIVGKNIEVDKNANNQNDDQDESRRHHLHLRHSHHSHHRSFKNGLRINVPPKIKPRQSRFVKENNKRFDALTNMVVKYGKYLESFPNNNVKTVPKKEQSKASIDSGRREPIKMRSYLKELKFAFEKRFHGLVQYDWLGTAVDTESSLMKLLGLILQVTNKKEIHRRDLTLLNYVKFLFESAVRNFPDYIIENTLQAYMPSEVIEEAGAMTEKFVPENPAIDKRPRAQSEEIFETPNSKYLFREYYIPEPYRRDDKTLLLNYFGITKEDKEKNLDDKTIIDTRFREFLIETQSILAELHVLFALTPNEPNPDDWVTVIQTLFISMSNHQRLKYAQILLHMFAAELFNNIESILNYPNLSLHDILRDNVTQVNEKVNDMILILKILTYIRLI